CRDTLNGLWSEALATIKIARRIVFVGYRFPPTDADAKRDILGTIAGHENSGALRIETVLGPRVESDDSVRLRKLLDFTRRLTRDQIDQIPLFAEDYLLRITPGR